MDRSTPRRGWRTRRVCRSSWRGGGTCSSGSSNLGGAAFLSLSCVNFGSGRDSIGIGMQELAEDQERRALLVEDESQHQPGHKRVLLSSAVGGRALRR